MTGFIYCIIIFIIIYDIVIIFINTYILSSKQSEEAYKDV